MRLSTMLIAGSAAALMAGAAYAQNAPSATFNSGRVTAPGTPSTSALPSPNSAPANAASPTSKPVTLERVDQYFIRKTAAGGAAEVETAKLAQQQSSNGQVKDFAQTMIDDHRKANDQLMDIAGKKGVSAAPDMTIADQEKEELGKLSGRAFDRKFAEMQVKDHEDAVKLFQDESKNGGDSDLKQFAAATLPTLDHHLTMAKHLEAEVSGTASLSHGHHRSGGRTQ